MENDNPLLDVDIVQRNKDWIDEYDTFMSDPEFEECLTLAVKIIAKPNVPQPVVAKLIVQLQAYALVFRARYNEYMMWRKGTTNANALKNCYRGMYEGIDRLVDSLKYLIKNG